MSDDPFEAAMNAMGGGDEEGKEKEAADPFESALETLEEESGDLAGSAAGGESTAVDSEADTAAPSAEGGGTADPFEAAMSALGDGEEQPAADPFESAMSAMDAGAGESTESAADPFESALQVAKSEHQVAPAEQTGTSEYNVDIDFLMDIKLEVTFEVGRAKMFISDLLSLGQGSVIELHRLVGEELEIFVNGHLFATGEVVVVNEKFGARITQVIAPEKRIQRLGTHAIM